MKAILKNYRQSPRKVRLIADMIRGKSVSTAVNQLDLLIKRGSLPVKKLLLNAVNNSNKKPEDLFVKTIQVNKGLVMKRFTPRAFGRASQILKRSSHITIELGDKTK
jgi:large subunit ribosomal protein L22